MHCEIAASQFYPEMPEQALRDAFIRLDNKFIAKSKKLVSAAGTWDMPHCIFNGIICIFFTRIAEIDGRHDGTVHFILSGEEAHTCGLGG